MGTNSSGGGPTGFADRLKRTRDAAKFIYLVRGNDLTARPAWYYLRVGPAKKLRFEVEARRGAMQLLDYGQILVSGFGEWPPPDVKKRMKDEYGFEA